MKQRLVVMNGQRIVQTSQGEGSSFEGGKNELVGKANGLKPGVYNLYSAKVADKSKSYDGQIVHADRGAVYQKTANEIIMHERKSFDKVPEIASTHNIKYDDNGQAVVSGIANSLGRGRSR